MGMDQRRHRRETRIRGDIFMKLVIQRVKEASVEIGGEIVGQIGNGCAVLIGVGQGDTKDEADYLADRLLGMRIFEDENGKMNRSIQDIGAFL
jgi:D-tyrosyl-tRNA(Tyr) deacylase